MLWVPGIELVRTPIGHVLHAGWERSWRLCNSACGVFCSLGCVIMEDVKNIYPYLLYILLGRSKLMQIYDILNVDRFSFNSDFFWVVINLMTPEPRIIAVGSPENVPTTWGWWFETNSLSRSFLYILRRKEINMFGKGLRSFTREINIQYIEFQWSFLLIEFSCWCHEGIIFHINLHGV